jgi:hypothetical protein
MNETLPPDFPFNTSGDVSILFTIALFVNWKLLALCLILNGW